MTKSAQRYRFGLIAFSAIALLGCDRDGTSANGGSSDALASADVWGQAEASDSLSLVNPDEGRRAAAEATWATVRPTCRSYHYTRRVTSSSGYTKTLVVQVEDEAVVRLRVIVVASPGFPGMTSSDTTFTGADAAGPYTVGDLHQECAGILKQDPGKFSFSLSIDDKGLGVPTTCIALRRNCFDECQEGISLSAFACTS